MSEDEELSSLIETILDATLDPLLWTPVLAVVSELDGISAVAEALGISEATVKTHLQHLFAKTGTSRQIDLVKLVATHASPLRQAS